MGADFSVRAGETADEAADEATGGTAFSVGTSKAANEAAGGAVDIVGAGEAAGEAAGRVSPVRVSDWAGPLRGWDSPRRQSLCRGIRRFTILIIMKM